jgi:SAM-dependent methyltransferase
LTELGEQVAAAGRMWGAADYDRLARRFAPVHDDLVHRLGVKPGERWLDVATGTGEVALRAAGAGARAVGVDISAELLDIARRKEGADAVRWDLGDAQALPYADGSFDVVASCFGVIFAPDVEAAAAELARVSAPGGRLGLACWRPNQGLHALYQRITGVEAPDGPAEWGRDDRVRELLGDAFELELDEGVWHLTADSPGAAVELMTEGAPPITAMIATLEPEQREEFRAAMLDYWSGFERDGRVDEPREYLIVTGRRR